MVPRPEPLDPWYGYEVDTVTGVLPPSTIDYTRTKRSQRRDAIAENANLLALVKLGRRHYAVLVASAANAALAQYPHAYVKGTFTLSGGPT